ncbi:MAG: capsular biosynthesis protein [Gammaproteobacteria bacterium]|nr:capsular biosynthesis protein [Gammaproteobacteria bacterium]
MIDLHCHMLPAIDDGAPEWDTALEMARIAISDGIRLAVCTPHIYPGLYENTAAGIGASVAVFEERLQQAGLSLRLGVGADTHLVPDIVASLRSGRIPTLNGSRYFLLEPPHHVAPPRLSKTCFALLTAGYIPVITHPERLSWIEDHYALFQELVGRGVWMQVTAGSLTGRFGHKARYWAERMLDEGIVHLLATDAHGIRRRPPLLAEGRQAAERWVGPEEAMRLVEHRPQAVVDDLDPSRLPIPPGLSCNSGSHLS